MSLELALQENTSAIHKLIALFTAGNLPLPVNVNPVMVVTEEKAKKPKAEKQETPASTASTEPAATTTTAEPAAAPEPKASPSEPTAAEVTAEDAVQLLRAVMAGKGRDAAIGLLDSFGVKKLSELPADKLAAFGAEANRVLAG